MRKNLQHAEAVVWIVAVAIVIIIGIAAATVPPYPLGRPSRDDAIVWITALTGAGTLGAVGVALWSAASAERRGERIRHDAVRPALTARISWDNAPTMWLNVYNWAQHPAINLRVSVAIASPMPMTHRLTSWPGSGVPSPVVLLNYREETATNAGGNGYHQYLTSDAAVAEGNSGYLILWYEDIMGWTWESKAAVTFGGDSLETGTRNRPIGLGDPKPIERCTDSWPAVDDREVIVK